MKRRMRFLAVLTALTCVLPLGSTTVSAAEDDLQMVELGSLQLPVPASFQRQQPRSRIIAHEFTTKPAEGDTQAGRMTIMAAGGSVKDNVDRWFGQFTQPDGGKTADVAKIEEQEIAGSTVHLVDVSGTYMDSPGPFAPGVEREGYRMLAAIVETPRANYFIKYYGPSDTIEANAEAFRAMVQGLK